VIDIGESVGNYQVTSKLGEGGMGMVFLAEHPVIGAKVALKAIHPRFARRVDIVSRFVNEAKVVNQIQHDHIVNISDFGTTRGGDFYFVMEYLPGETLSQRIARRGALPVPRALNIAVQIADALQAAHEHGVVHRDVKPDNVILVPRGETTDFVKVLDFGLAKLTDDAEPQLSGTGAGLIMGSPEYMSPEQCEGRAEIDHRSDVYALGIVVFQMLTGRAPFNAPSYRNVLLQQLTASPPTARSLARDLPPEIDPILARALAKDPAARFQTMAEFGAALRDPWAFAPDPQPAKAKRSSDEDLQPKKSPGPLLKVVTFAAAAAAFIAEPDLRASYDLVHRAVVGAVRSGTLYLTLDPRPAAAPVDDAADLGVDSDPPLPATPARAGLPALASEQQNRPRTEGNDSTTASDPAGVLLPSRP
jgi:serine/threonine-protein kinase